MCTHDRGIDLTVGIAVSESALWPPKYSFSTFLICFLSFSRSFFVRSSYFFWLRSASFWAFSFLDSTFFLHSLEQNDFINVTHVYRFDVALTRDVRTCFALSEPRPLCPSTGAPAVFRVWPPTASPWENPNPEPTS